MARNKNVIGFTKSTNFDFFYFDNNKCSLPDLQKLEHLPHGKERNS